MLERGSKSGEAQQEKHVTKVRSEKMSAKGNIRNNGKKGTRTNMRKEKGGKEEKEGKAEKEGKYRKDANEQESKDRG